MLAIGTGRIFLRGGTNSQSGCAKLLFCKMFAENCTKMKFGPQEGWASLAPLGSPNGFVQLCWILVGDGVFPHLQIEMSLV